MEEKGEETINVKNQKNIIRGIESQNPLCINLQPFRKQKS